jgi:flagellar capping protein FliD
MKNNVLMLTILSVLFAFNVNAGNASLFQFDQNKVNAEMNQLSKVENYVSTHNGVTLEQLKAENNDIVSGVNLTESTSTLSALTEGPLGIPSFIWGCVLGWIGILITYLVTQDSEETKRALYGCLIGYVGLIVIYLIGYVLILGNQAFWSLQ